MILGNDTQTSLPARRIRKLFLEPKENYSLTDAAQMLGIMAKVLRAWIDVGEVEAIEGNRGLTIPWAEVVAFGMDFWPCGGKVDS